MHATQRQGNTNRLNADPSIKTMLFSCATGQAGNIPMTICASLVTSRNSLFIATTSVSQALPTSLQAHIARGRKLPLPEPKPPRVVFELEPPWCHSADKSCAQMAIIRDSLTVASWLQGRCTVKHAPHAQLIDNMVQVLASAWQQGCLEHLRTFGTVSLAHLSRTKQESRCRG